MSEELSAAERAKFRILAEGIVLTDEARHRLNEATHHRALTPADYASTSGIIVVLEQDVWVNAPVVDHNPNFVTSPSQRLDLVDDRLALVGGGDAIPARCWIPPEYHDWLNPWGEPYTSYAITHTDRVRVSPVEGCAMTCKFCDLPYEFRYRTKRVEGLVDAVRRALVDPVQPAHHVLVSGGTPREVDYGYLVECYEAMLSALPDTPVDIMMVPIEEALPIERLDALGLDELSVNIELFGRDLARSLMRRKFDQGLDHYLDFLARAAELLGGDRVRSMLMAGLEPMADTLAGVRAIAERGCIPVLSPFRPDGSTPLRDEAPPTAEFLTELYLRARDVSQQLGVRLGPKCLPCSHNTLTLSVAGAGDADHAFGEPVLVS